MTLEPGYYLEGEFGIRLENILEVVQKFPGKKHYSGEIFLGFKDITLVPYEPKMIDYNMLTVYQVQFQLINIFIIINLPFFTFSETLAK